MTASTRARFFVVALALAASAAVLPSAHAAAPVSTNTERPTVSGKPVAGARLTCRPGTWTGRPGRLTVRWTRDGAVAGRTGTTYRVTRSDVGARIACRVTAANARRAARSEDVEIVTAPTTASRPVVTLVDGTLTCAPGTWDHDPERLVYSWTRDGSPVPDAVEPTLTPVGDGGYVCLVAGRNVAGQSGYVASEAVRVGAALPDTSGPAPENATAPSLSVDSHGVLRCAPGTWTGQPELVYSWTRDGSPVEGATSATLAPGEAGTGATFACLVAGRNGSGQSGYVVSAGLTYLGPAAYQVDTWTASGSTATAVSDGSDAAPRMKYDQRGYRGAWSFTATARKAGSQTVGWRWEGFHAWFYAHAGMTAVVRDGTGAVTYSETLVDNYVSGGWEMTGSVTFPVAAGSTYGFELNGSNFDSTNVLAGTLSLTPAG